MHIKYLFNVKGCGTTIKEALPAAARETLFIVATKLESIAKCGTIPVPPITGIPKMSRSWRIRGAAQYMEKMKAETMENKGGP